MIDVLCGHEKRFSRGRSGKSYEGVSLPTTKKLDPIESSFFRGEYRIRTDDPLHAMQVL